MRPLIFSINVTLDGCCHHQGVPPTEELHRHATAWINRADALLFGRVIYQMMESAFRLQPGATSVPGLTEWMQPFARTIHAAKKYVVSNTLPTVDWNAELIRDNLAHAVQQLKNQPGKAIATGGLTLPLALADLGLIDEYQLIVHPIVAGRGPTLFAGLSKPLNLKLLDRKDFTNGVVALRYEPQR